MNYTPVKETRRLTALCVPLFCLAFLLFWSGNFLPFGALMQAIGGILLVVTLFLTLRFALSSFRYEICDGSLLIFRRQGKREEQVCGVDLDSLVSLSTKEEFQKEKPAHALCYNFSQNFASKNRTYLLFVFNDLEDKRALLIFEPNEEMIEELRRHI